MIQLLFCTPIDFMNGPMAQQNREMILTNLVRFFAAGGAIEAEEWAALTMDQQNLIIQAKTMVDGQHMAQQAVTHDLVDRAQARADAEATPPTIPDAAPGDFVFNMTHPVEGD